jgi:hypothetical protein
MITKLVARETKTKDLKYYLAKILKPVLSLSPFYRIVNLLTIIQINKKIRNTKQNVLCVGGPDDRMKFLEIESTNFDINIIWFPRRVVDWLFLKHIKVYKTIGLGEWNLDQYYDNKIVNQNEREKLRKKYSILLNDLKRLFNIKCLLLPKLNDDWIVDFQLAAKKIEMPIIVSDRESAITQKRMEVYPSLLAKHKRDLNVADYITVNNDMHLEFFLKSGIDTKKLILTGSPQSDIWKVKRYSQPLNNLVNKLDKNKKNVLYLGFGVRAYLNFYYKNDDRTWDTLCKEVHEELANFIINNKDQVNFLYKIGSKPARDYWHGYDDFYEKLKKNGAENSIIQVRDKILTPELLPQIDLTVSFQTTGVVEAMFHNAPIIYLGWGELYDDIKHTLHDFENSGVLYASSKKILRDLLNGYINDDLPQMDRNKFDKWKYDFFYKADGKASNRILSLVSEITSRK